MLWRDIVTADEAEREFRAMISAPVPVVWGALTLQLTPASWLLGMWLQVSRQGVRAGSKFAIRSATGEFTPVFGEIIECEPPAYLWHTLLFVGLDEKCTSLSHTLRAVGSETELTLRLGEIVPESYTEKQARRVCRLIPNRLQAVLSGKEVPSDPDFADRLLGSLIPFGESARTEHWPV